MQRFGLCDEALGVLAETSLVERNGKDSTSVRVLINLFTHLFTGNLLKGKHGSKVFLTILQVVGELRSGVRVMNVEERATHPSKQTVLECVGGIMPIPRCSVMR